MAADELVDLTQVILINESRCERTPGDISIFANESEACASLEPWWVRDKEGTVLTASGDRLTLAPTTPVKVLRRDPYPDGDQLVRIWLEDAAEHLRSIGRHPHPVPSSISELITYIGFER